MRTVDLILRKRGGDELSVDEIRYLINGYTTGEIPDYQVSAFLMATYFSGMTDRELSSFTEVMIASGETLTLEEVNDGYALMKKLAVLLTSELVAFAAG